MVCRRLLPVAAFGVTLFVCAQLAPISAAEPIDLELNPVTGLIEAVAVSQADGDRIRHVEDPGQGEAVVDTVVSSEPATDSRIAIKSNGESWVVWHDAVAGAVRVAYRDSATKSWSLERTLSLPGELSGKPSIVHAGDATWIAYEIGSGMGRSVAVLGIEDSPEPFPTREILATTSSVDALDVTLHAELGRVWLTWIGATGVLGWSQYDHLAGHWTAPRVESYLPSTLASARASVRTRVLAP